MHCMLKCIALVFCMCVSGQPGAQTSSSVAVISIYSRGIYHTLYSGGT